MLDAAVEHVGAAAVAAPDPAPGRRLDAVCLGQVEQARAALVPGRSDARAGERDGRRRGGGRPLRRGAAEALAADPLGGHPAGAQAGRELVEEGGRTAEVVLRARRDAELAHRRRRDPALGVVVVAAPVARLGAAVAHVQPAVRQARDQVADLLAERVLAAAARAVEPPHLAPRPIRGERVQHRQHGRRADARADQHHRAPARAVEHERPARAGELEHVAGLDRRVQVAAEDALALHADAVAAPVRRGRERVAARLPARPGHVGADGDELAGIERREPLPVHRLERERRHAGALGRDLRDAEAAERRPAARRRQDPHQEQEQDRRARGEQQHAHPRLRRVGARAERVRDGQDVDEDRRAMQLAPERGADAVADPVGQPEQRGEPAADHAEPGPERLVADHERDRDAGQPG